MPASSAALTAPATQADTAAHWTFVAAWSDDCGGALQPLILAVSGAESAEDALAAVTGYLAREYNAENDADLTPQQVFPRPGNTDGAVAHVIYLHPGPPAPRPAFPFDLDGILIHLDAGDYLDRAAEPHAEHEEGLYLQPLPACLAPSDAERAETAGMTLPTAGDPVVLHGGQVLFLHVIDQRAGLTEENTLVYAATMFGCHRCDGARWGSESLWPLDPDFPGLDEGDGPDIRTAWHLLLARTPAA